MTLQEKMMTKIDNDIICASYSDCACAGICKLKINSAQDCSVIAEEFACEFAEWIRINDYQSSNRKSWIGLNLEYYTTQELIIKFKEQIK